MISTDVYCFGAKFEMDPHVENPEVILQVRHYIEESERKSSLLSTGRPLPRITVTRFHFPPGKVPTNIADIIHLDRDGSPLMIDLAPDDASEVLPVRRIFLYESGTHIMHCAICGSKMKYEELEHILLWCTVKEQSEKSLPSDAMNLKFCAESLYSKYRHIRLAGKSRALCGAVVHFDREELTPSDQGVKSCCPRCTDALCQFGQEQ